MSETSAVPPHKIIGVAVIWNDQEQILIDRRRPEGVMGGLWEFPGGKIEPGETVEECIQREIYEELGIEIEVREHLITIDHTYTHLRVTLTVHQCCLLTGIPQPLECDEIRWVNLDELEEFAFPQANSQIISALKGSRRVGEAREAGEAEEIKLLTTDN
ncbi:DNA mismatch repair protein MutT [Nostoc minutum NIES-26]|uniref:8-oxo-dGTP diphosphatase n=1 Tax=Nostoc minutum NIES-26 TaxID=1844469 RepID=A0A367S073_9NOSO|nr:DNA mismatch repair protein MutT [Nostoc minutum NIES-26]